MVSSTQAIRTHYSYALYSTYCFNSSSDGDSIVQGNSGVKKYNELINYAIYRTY